MPEEKEEKKAKLILWLKRLGFWGFMFFLIKGLIWLFFLAQIKECLD